MPPFSAIIAAVSCAEASNVAVSAFRKVAVAPLCRALADSISVERPELSVVSSAMVIAERPLVQTALRCLFEHLLHGNDTAGTGYGKWQAVVYQLLQGMQTEIR